MSLQHSFKVKVKTLEKTNVEYTFKHIHFFCRTEGTYCRAIQKHQGLNNTKMGYIYQLYFIIKSSAKNLSIQNIIYFCKYHSIIQNIQCIGCLKEKSIVNKLK